MVRSKYTSVFPYEKEQGKARNVAMDAVNHRFIPEYSNFWQEFRAFDTWLVDSHPRVLSFATLFARISARLSVQ